MAYITVLFSFFCGLKKTWGFEKVGKLQCAAIADASCPDFVSHVSINDL
jgi:hypothetical protein